MDEKPICTWSSASNSVIALYFHRNAMFLPSPFHKMQIILDAWRMLLKIIRRDTPNPKEARVVMAQLFARVSSYADSFIELDILTALWTKLPRSGCPYCNNDPCSCLEGRKSVPIKFESPLLVSDRRISEWIEAVKNRYGENNRKRGIHSAVNRLGEELVEVSNAQNMDRLTDRSITLSDRREMVAREFADVYLWIFAISDLLSVDLEEVLIERYFGTCKTCNKRPCDCISPLLKPTVSSLVTPK